MGHLIFAEKKPHENPAQNLLKNIVKNQIKNQNGSAILIAMLLLLLMTIIGISASNTSVTESFIIRNVGLHKQNMNMVEAAAIELAQEALINIADPSGDNLAESSPVRERWIVSDTEWANTTSPNGLSSYHDAWYDIGVAGAGRLFTGDGTAFPQYTWPGDDFFAENTTASPSGDLTILDIRGEAGDTPLRMALVGWDAAPGSSLKVTAATRKKARVLAEYVSPNYGLMRLEIGLERAY
jgi:hypothetical protein